MEIETKPTGKYQIWLVGSDIMPHIFIAGFNDMTDAIARVKYHAFIGHAYGIYNTKHKLVYTAYTDKEGNIVADYY